MLKGGINIIKDISTEKREVIFAFSKFNDYDSDNDITFQGAFSKTIKESGPEGADRIRHVWNHDKNNPPVGRIIKMWEDSDYAYAQTKILTNELANNIWEGYSEGAINEHSYFGKSYNPERNEKGGLKIKEVKLFEVSTVLWGAQENAKLKQLIKGEFNDVEALEGLAEHLKSLETFVRKSNATDDFLIVLESEINKGMDIILPLLKSGRNATPEPIEPKLELTLADIYKLKSFN